jgi:hypothetical protein
MPELTTKSPSHSEWRNFSQGCARPYAINSGNSRRQGDDCGLYDRHSRPPCHDVLVPLKQSADLHRQYQKAHQEHRLDSVLLARSINYPNISLTAIQDQLGRRFPAGHITEQRRTPSPVRALNSQRLAAATPIHASPNRRRLFARDPRSQH